MRHFIYLTICLFAVAVSVLMISHNKMVRYQKYGDSLQSCLDLQKELIDNQEMYINGMEKALNRIRPVTVTAYTASLSECNTEPEMTASMQRVKPGTVAVSRDLFNNGWVFGSKIYIEGHGVFEISDLMNKKHTNSIDIYMGTPDEARQFGIEKGIATLILS
jgi:3D (Asp-Asp-Asp) domain-containing protein